VDDLQPGAGGGCARRPARLRRNADTGIMRRASVRAINGIDGSVRLNQANVAI
jgi:hypothetical protein